MATPRNTQNSAPGVIALWDNTLPKSMQLVGARSLGATNADNFSFVCDSTHNQAFLFQGSGTTQFWFSCWMTLNFDSTASGTYNGAPIFGVMNAAATRFPWLLRFGSSGSGTAHLDLHSYNGTSNNTARVTQFFNPSGATKGMWSRRLFHVFGVYNGASTGDNTAVLKVWFNGTQGTTAAGSSLPQQIPNPAAGSSTVFCVGVPFTGNQQLPMTICDLVIGSGVPSSNTDAVREAYNRGHGVTYSEWLANSALPTPLAYYTFADGIKAEPNLTTLAGVPAGNAVNSKSPGTYDLTKNGSPTGVIYVKRQADIVGGKIRVFGWSQSTPNGRRSGWPEWRLDPTVASSRYGRPQLYGGKPHVAPTPEYGAAQSICSWPGLQATMGSSGALVWGGNLYQKNVGNNEVFGVCDFETNVGVSTTAKTRNVCELFFVGQDPYLAPPASKGTCTISAANPAVVTCNNHGLVAGDGVLFSTTGTLPSPVNPKGTWSRGAPTAYFVSSTGLTSNSFQMTTTPLSGSTISTNGSSQSGTHTLWGCHSTTTTGSVFAELCLERTDPTGGSAWIFASVIQSVQGIEQDGVNLAENTYPSPDGTYHYFELGNNGSGAVATEDVLCPPGSTSYFIAIDGVNQTQMLDSGGAGANNNWASTIPNLNTVHWFCVPDVQTNGTITGFEMTEYGEAFSAIIAPRSAVSSSVVLDLAADRTWLRNYLSSR